jgi:hypothetical protein
MKWNFSGSTGLSFNLINCTVLNYGDLFSGNISHKQ